jgi:soluble lytic murein transglycosylase-like protein
MSNSIYRGVIFTALAIAVVATPALAHEHVHHFRHHRVAADQQDGNTGWQPSGFANIFSSNQKSPKSSAPPSEYEGMVAQQASANGVPASLIHRVIMRESRYNPRAVSAGNYGLMQIRLGTARAMGYTGSAAGLLDAQTNMTYAVRYLAGAYHAAGGNESRAVALYASGYGGGRVRAKDVTPYETASAGDGFAPVQSERTIKVAHHFRHHHPAS